MFLRWALPLVALLVASEMGAATPSHAQPDPPPTLEPVMMVLGPGETGQLPRLAWIPLPPTPGQPTRYRHQDVPVANQSDHEATITSDGQTITVTMRVGLAVRVEV